jgi:hypothetical protein
MHRDWSMDLGPGATIGPTNFPAKYSFSNTVAVCFGSGTQPDFIVYGTGLAGGTTQGDIVAFTNLYDGCPNDPKPASYWSYNTGGTVQTSPVLSLDGTQVAFTQTTGGVASLVLLKWNAFDGPAVQTPLTITGTDPASYAACPTLPCMTAFSLGANDTNSSAYYDYGSDTIWVGDDSGKLHQFTGVFLGTPAENTSGWPVTVSATKVLTSAVHDDNTGNTFVGDSTGVLYRVDSGGGITPSAQLDAGTGLAEGPIIDSSAGSVYVFSSNNGGSAAVVQLTTAFTTGETGTATAIGAATSSAAKQYNGAFDHDYVTAATPTGNLYVCGDPGGLPTIYQIPINNGTMSASKAGPVISTTTETQCSPLTDVYNSILQGAGLPQEWVFASVQAAGTPTPCGTHSCVMNFKVTSWQPNTVYNTGQEILDSNLSIEVAENPLGTSGPIPPIWNSATFSTTGDGGVHWRSQGPLSAQTPGSWAKNTFFNGGQQIIDTNNNIEIESFLGGGTTSGTEPIWPMTEGTSTPDGGVVWYNLGANPVAALAAPGGTSGIIIDNTVNNPGGSQVYYSTMQDSSCGGNNIGNGGGTGGCAVQASQQGLN